MGACITLQQKMIFPYDFFLKKASFSLLRIHAVNPYHGHNYCRYQCLGVIALDTGNDNSYDCGKGSQYGFSVG